MTIELVAADLPLTRRFRISRNETVASRSYFLLADGAVGEAAPVRFYGELPETVEAGLRYLIRQAEAWQDPRSLWPRLDSALGYQSAAKCGIDLLMWDRFGRREGATIGQLLGLPVPARLETALSIGIGTAEEMREEVRRRPGFAAYKIKAGFAGDLEAVAAIREVTDAPLYVDANGGWTPDEACARLPRLAELGVVLCEQPIFSGRKRDWEQVRAAAGMPVIVDEHCRREEDVAHWAGWADGVNVKLQKAGGITPAYAMIRRAREEGLQVMIGCMIESSVGIAAAAQLAALADYRDLDSHLLLAADPYRGIPWRDGALVPSGRPGLGVEPAAESGRT